MPAGVPENSPKPPTISHSPTAQRNHKERTSTTERVRDGRASDGRRRPPRSVVLGVRCGARLRRGRPATPDGRSIVVILSCLAACWPLVCRAWPACVLPLHLGGTDKVRPPFSWRPFLLFFVVWAPCFAFFLIHADEHAAALGAVVVASIEVLEKLFCAAIFADAAWSSHRFREVS